MTTTTEIIEKTTEESFGKLSGHPREWVDRTKNMPTDLYSIDGEKLNKLQLKWVKKSFEYFYPKVEKFVDELLEDKNFSTLERNLPILSKFMPKSVSEEIYKGSIKQRTEIDMIMKYKNIILLISIKYRERKKKRDFNVLSKELYYVTRWYLQQNRNYLLGVPIITSNLVELKRPLTHAFYIPIRVLKRELLFLCSNIHQLYNKETQAICYPRLESLYFDPV